MLLIPTLDLTFHHGKKQNELLHNTSRFLEMELWSLKVVQIGILCTVHAQLAFFIFDRLYLMTYVSSGDGKGSFFFQF